MAKSMSYETGTPWFMISSSFHSLMSSPDGNMATTVFTRVIGSVARISEIIYRKGFKYSEGPILLSHDVTRVLEGQCSLW